MITGPLDSSFMGTFRMLSISASSMMGILLISIETGDSLGGRREKVAVGFLICEN